MRARHRLQAVMWVGILAGLAVGPLSPGWAAEKTAAQRGEEIVLRWSLNPPVWSRTAYENAWKQWGVADKPANYAQAFRDRYGLHAAPFDNYGLPMGLVESQGLLGKGIVNSCLLCHAGVVAGRTLIGAPNASIDLQSFFVDMSKADGFALPMPFPLSYVRGTVDVVNPTTFLVELRDTELNLQKPARFGYSQHVSSDPPAWWLLKRKKIRGWTGSIDARSNRVDMVNLLTPFNSAAYIKKQEQAFVDIGAFVHSVEAPKYPFPIDRELASRGESVFADNCAKCHGTYGPGGRYPNKVVSLETIGTDPVLATALKPELGDYFNRSWFARELGPDGKPYRFLENKGYQAPPLDGVWATAPYFHNGSAPTVYHVLNSKARPAVFTRSYRTGEEEYDRAKLGWKVRVLERAPDAAAPGHERRRVYDTAQPGQGNGGHTFGDRLSDDERAAVIEYLKTL